MQSQHLIGETQGIALDPMFGSLYSIQCATREVIRLTLAVTMS